MINDDKQYYLAHPRDGCDIEKDNIIFYIWTKDYLGNVKSIPNLYSVTFRNTL